MCRLTTRVSASWHETMALHVGHVNSRTKRARSARSHSWAATKETAYQKSRYQKLLTLRSRPEDHFDYSYKLESGKAHKTGSHCRGSPGSKLGYDFITCS
ncbi:hypothetical protein J6590_007491 [Homalodisca vitripennis]|nr:hypothetical protein J6590_007491 [Homalodisca vitripennis]